MGLQLIFCVECNKQFPTDYIYIKNTINHFYNYDRSAVKLTQVYMNGKGNYSSAKIQREIVENIKKYETTSKQNESVVIYCLDCDDYDKKPEDLRFLKSTEDYCNRNGYRFVWFCKDIEDVYWGRRVSKGEKVGLATTFASGNKVAGVDISILRENTYKMCRSNLCSVLDEVLSKYLV